ncbi:SsrA-binding protein SmpB [Blochmannia endosymbiont of Colobopsis nipponica]|uniref:SsrA-binding protein SmpB n=1 Tax=Blochmannia endosymbiont of Colobopsis nipponica TaxID=2681987 RepID=UPI00177DA3B6|nr:SsrA-binding protein SmpB [Blochmannia endosymbiont of Colobopsis nipponica]QOI10925.1 SsrA-binding protein SmpB [Blochmannia endosymbiont of Colobopsis nipponica]
MSYKKEINNIIRNKKARFKYYIEQEIEAGLSLLGWEVKSARNKNIVIDNGYITFKNKEAYLSAANFGTSAKYYNSSSSEYNSLRNRKILLKKNQLCLLFNKIQCKEYKAIPLDLYWKNTWLKLNIGIVKRKKYDKRNKIKDKEWKIKKHTL